MMVKHKWAVAVFVLAVTVFLVSVTPEQPAPQTISTKGGANIRKITQNSGLVRVNGYALNKTGYGNWTAIDTLGNAYGTTGTDTVFECIVLAHKARVRQHGTVRQAKFYVRYLGGTTAWYLVIWRRNPTTGKYNVVGRCDVLSQLTARQVNTVTLPTPIEGVRPGDFYGIRQELTGTQATYAFKTTTPACSDTIGITCRIKNAVYDASEVHWEGVGSADKSATIYKVELYMSPPQIVWLGDSNMAGHKGASGKQNFAFSEHVCWNGTVHTDTVNIDSTMADVARDTLNYSYQLIGKGGGQVVAMLTRAAEVIAATPSACVISVGGNDAAGAITNDVFVTRYTLLVDSLLNNDIETYCMQIPPINNSAAATEARMDSFNIAIQNICGTRDNCYYIPCRNYIAQYDSSGYAANLWDGKSAYMHADSIHVNISGQKRMVHAFIDWGLKLLD